MAFYVGQKVVCVYDRFAEGRGGRIRPCVGYEYTVAWYGWFDSPFYPEESTFCVHLVEIKRDPATTADGKQTTLVVPFRADRFRPVVERKTDISIFTALLNPANHKHLENV